LRDVSERFGPWQTAFDRFNHSRIDGTFRRVQDRLQLRLDAEGRINRDVSRDDGGSVRAHAKAAREGERGV